MEKLQSNQIVRLFLRLGLILIIILIFDQGIGMILKKYYFRQRHGDGSNITYAIDSTVADVLIFGSSRAKHHYIPTILEDRFKYSCFNVGADGNYLLYSYAIFKTIVNRYNPKLIIFDIRPYELGYIASEYDRLSQLLPYYQKYPEIQHAIELRGPFEKFKHISSIYSFNSLILEIVRGNIGYSKSKNSDLHGYTPIYKAMKPEKIGTWDICSIVLDEDKINVLKDIILTCSQKNINLIFVHSPIWITMKKSNCHNIISDVCSENNVPYIDISNDSTFMNRPDYFEDLSHLNNEGAKIFSNMLIDRIIQSNLKGI
jgi:hypothetical protein